MGRVEIKKSVIEDRVRTVGHILYPDGGVAVQLINGLSGLTCKQICVYAVTLCLDFRKQEG